MKILLIDHYDSFTYNLADYLAPFGVVTTVRHNTLTLHEIRCLAPDRIVLSPGPGTPQDVGASMEIVQCFGPTVPILGVCLGLQCIGEVFGGRVIRALRPVHGKAWPVQHDGSALFHGIPSPFHAGRYHSLVVDRTNMPAALSVTAWTAEGEIMGLAHREFPVLGVQFHPESVLSAGGHRLLENFCRIGASAFPVTPSGTEASPSEPATVETR